MASVGAAVLVEAAASAARWESSGWWWGALATGALAGIEVLDLLAAQRLFRLAVFSVTLAAERGLFAAIREEGLFCVEPCLGAGEAVLNTDEMISRAALRVMDVTLKRVEVARRSVSRGSLIAFGDSRMFQERSSCWE